MDTKDFFDVVLPQQGRRCIGYADSGKFQNSFSQTNEWLANGVARLDTRSGEVYYGLAGYGAESTRKQDNVVAVRSFWLDIDTNENGKGKSTYADRKEAIKALAKFNFDLGLPSPYIVSSGYGVHVYWPCDSDITPAAWLQTATLLKKVAKFWGLDADPSRTADSASVLRAPGSTNKKYGTTKSVKLVAKGEITSHPLFHMLLEEYLEENGQAASAPVQNLNSDLAGPPPEYAPSNGRKIADNCAVMAEMRDTRGNLEQPVWYGCVGVLAFTEEGDELAHEWSNGHADYNPAETDAKLAQARKYAPTTCEKLSENRTNVCQACPHWGKIKSPITLGTSFGAPNPIPAEALPEVSEPWAGETTVKAIPTMPDGYEVVNGGITRKNRVCEKDDNGNDVWIDKPIPVSDILFWPTARIRDDGDCYAMNIYMKDRQGHAREFVLDSGEIAEGGAALISKLGSKEIVGKGGKGGKTELANYLSAWVGKLRDEYSATPAVNQFGWHGDNFVIGTSYITKDGLRKAVTVKGAASNAKFLEPAGNLADWVSLVDQVYNHPGQEAHQFSILASFASPLFKLFGGKGGVFVHSHSSASGKGKSTAQFVGLSAWGNHEELLLREGLAMATVNAMFNHFGVMNNLPIVIDEMTNCSNAFASELVYNVSAGAGKKRMNADESTRTTLNWGLIACGSSNNLIGEKLSLHRSNAAGELARIWEFEVTAQPSVPTHVANRLIPAIYANHGHAGRAYAKYLVENKDAVTQMLFDIREKFDRKANISQSERYWSMLHASILTALTICKRIGVLQFDTKGLLNWIMAELANNRTQVDQSVLDPLEQFGDLLADIFPGVLVTHGEGNLASSSGPVTIIQHPRGPITGRSILPDSTSSERLFVSSVAAKQWCNTKRVSFKEVHGALVKAGWAKPDLVRVSLGKGTDQYSGLGGPAKCLEINPSAVRAVMGNQPIAQKIHAVYQGGIDAAAATGSV